MACMKHAASARRTEQRSRWTGSICASRRAASSASSAQRRGKDHRAQRDPRPHPVSGRTEGARTRPWTERDQLMRDVCFIADVAVLPRWMGSGRRSTTSGGAPAIRSGEGGGLPGEDQDPRGSKVRELSKGMVTQLHLALVMAIDASCWCWTSRRWAWTSCTESSSTTRCSTTTSTTPHHPGDDPPGGRDPGRPHRPHVHRPRPHRARVQHGGIRDALREAMVNPENLEAARALKPMTSDRSSAAASCSSTASIARSSPASARCASPASPTSSSR